MKLIAKKKDVVTVSFIDQPASEDVTGSMVIVKTPKHTIALDCGIHQTNDKKSDFLVNSRRYKQVKAKDIDIVFISHLHADHCLLAPKLYLDGCRATTIVSEGSTGTYAKMAADSARINERDILVINNQETKNYKPLYTQEDVDSFLGFIEEYPINEKIVIDEELAFKLVPSGHLLGGTQIILYITYNNKTETIVYTGDIGNKIVGNKFVGELEEITKASLFIGESTYGDRPDIKTGVKERKNDLDKLKTTIDTQVCERKGRVLIPSFAQSRSQQLAYMIYELYKDDKDFKYKVCIDSPLAISIFEEYASTLQGEEKQEFANMLNWDNLVMVQDSEDSKALVSSKEPCVIISSSGMCQVGRIRHHLKSLISNSNATILFVGFSTEGSLASLLKDAKRKEIDIDNVTYPIRCNSYSLKSMSGHATFDLLCDYYSNVNTPKIVLHHGSMSSKLKLKEALEKRLAKECKSTRVVVANSSLKFNL